MGGYDEQVQLWTVGFHLWMLQRVIHVAKLTWLFAFLFSFLAFCSLWSIYIETLLLFSTVTRFFFALFLPCFQCIYLFYDCFLNMHFLNFNILFNHLFCLILHFGFTFKFFYIFKVSLVYYFLMFQNYMDSGVQVYIYVEI